MRQATWSSIFVLLSMLATSCSSTRLTASVGHDYMVDSSLPVDEMTAGGLELSSGPEEGGFGFELGYRHSSGSFAGDKLELGEVYVGPRYEWQLDRLRPFLAVGASLLDSDWRIGGVTQGGGLDLGWYASAGVDYQIMESLFLGLALRRTFNHFDAAPMFEDELDNVNAWQLALRLGYSF